MIWKSCDLQIKEGQTENEQRFAIPVLFSDFPECSHAVIDGVRQEITQKIDLAPRYTVIQVKVYKE